MKTHYVLLNMKFFYIIFLVLAVFSNCDATAQINPSKTAVQIRVVEVGNKDSVVVDTTVMLEKSQKKRKIFVGGLNDIIIYGNDSILKNVSIYDTHNILSSKQNSMQSLLYEIDSFDQNQNNEAFDIAYYDNDSVIIHRFNKDNGVDTLPDESQYFFLSPGSYNNQIKPINMDGLMTELQTQMLHVDSLIRKNIDWKKIDSMYIRGIDTLPQFILRKLHHLDDVDPPQDNFESKSRNLEDIIDELEPGDGKKEPYPRGENDYPNKAPVYKAPLPDNKETE